MRRKEKAYRGLAFIASFLLWTILVRNFDVGAIGPNGSLVGFSTLNGLVHDFIGVNMNLYVITDWLGIIPLLFIIGFGIFGLAQWIKRKSITKVDFDILALGVFYIIVMGVYLTFENVVINFRPVLIEGFLEASYPSSTTMLVVCVIPSAIMVLNSRIERIWVKRAVTVTLTVFGAFMVAGRLISGVHWLTDILGGILISKGLVMLYDFARK